LKLSWLHEAPPITTSLTGVQPKVLFGSSKTRSVEYNGEEFISNINLFF
jgi:hypothetical protein